ncbi:MAG: hypothetical protein H0T89_25570 [Deltaproteobacteria bacterium]|nr:hypothetical protein [Deltaproteobacteria bacterium]
MLRAVLFEAVGDPMDEHEYVEYFGQTFKGEVAYVDDNDVIRVGHDPLAPIDEREDLTHLLPSFPLEE